MRTGPDQDGRRGKPMAERMHAREVGAGGCVLLAAAKVNADERVARLMNANERHAAD
jgi:hypothetical protein